MIESLRRDYFPGAGREDIRVAAPDGVLALEDPRVGLRSRLVQLEQPAGSSVELAVEFGEQDVLAQLGRQDHELWHVLQFFLRHVPSDSGLVYPAKCVPLLYPDSYPLLYPVFSRESAEQRTRGEIHPPASV